MDRDYVKLIQYIFSKFSAARINPARESLPDVEPCRTALLVAAPGEKSLA